MKKVSIFLFVALFLPFGNVLAIQKKDIAIGGLGAFIFVSSGYFNIKLRNEYGALYKKYSPKKDEIRKYLKELHSDVLVGEGNANRNREIIEKVYTIQGYTFENPSFDFSNPYEINLNGKKVYWGNLNGLIHQLNHINEIVTLYEPAKKLYNIGCAGGLLLLSFAGLNSKYRWF